MKNFPAASCALHTEGVARFLISSFADSGSPFIGNSGVVVECSDQKDPKNGNYCIIAGVILG